MVSVKIEPVTLTAATTLELARTGAATHLTPSYTPHCRWRSPVSGHFRVLSELRNGGYRVLSKRFERLCSINALDLTGAHLGQQDLAASGGMGAVLNPM